MNLNRDTECKFDRTDSSAKPETAWDGLASAAYSPDTKAVNAGPKSDTSSEHLPQPIIIEDNPRKATIMPYPDKETYPSWTKADKMTVPGLDLAEELPTMLPMAERPFRYDGLRHHDRISNYYDNAISMVTDYDRRRASEIMDRNLDHWREPSERRILWNMEEHILRGDLRGLRRDLSRISPDMLEDVIEELNHQFERTNSGLHITLSEGKVVIYKDHANHALEIDPRDGRARVGLLDTKQDGTVALLPGAVLNPKLRDVVRDLADTAVRNINADRPSWDHGYGGTGGIHPRPYRPADEVPPYRPEHPYRPWNGPGSGSHIVPDYPGDRPGIEQPYRPWDGPGSGSHIMPDYPGDRPGIEQPYRPWDGPGSSIMPREIPDPRRPCPPFPPIGYERPAAVMLPDRGWPSRPSDIDVDITWGRHRPWGGSIKLPCDQTVNPRHPFRIGHFGPVAISYGSNPYDYHQSAKDFQAHRN